MVMDGKESIAGLLQVSLGALDDAAYEAFLAFGGMFTPSSTPELMARALRRDAEMVEDALFSLVQRGLAERVVKAGSDVIAFRVHDLAHSYTRTRTPVRIKTAVRATQDFLVPHKDDLDSIELEFGNVLAAAEAADEDSLVKIMHLLCVDGSFYMARGHNSRSIALLKNAIEITKEKEDFETAHQLLNDLGNTYFNTFGDLDKALGAYQEALEYARVVGDKGREAVFLGMIGVVLFHGQLDNSEYYLKQAYQLAKSCDDDNKPLYSIRTSRLYYCFSREVEGC